MLLGIEQTLVASSPRMKGPALLALLPDIPGHCSLLALPDVSPAPLSDERRLDILELYGENKIRLAHRIKIVKSKGYVEHATARKQTLSW